MDFYKYVLWRVRRKVSHTRSCLCVCPLPVAVLSGNGGDPGVPSEPRSRVRQRWKHVRQRVRAVRAETVSARAAAPLSRHSHGPRRVSRPGGGQRAGGRSRPLVVEYETKALHSQC